MKLVYLSTARIPSETANSFQVLQMCNAFQERGAELTLLHPRRVNTPAMRAVQDIHAYYGMRLEFSRFALPVLDLIWTAGSLHAPQRLQALAHRLMIASYRRNARQILRARPADWLYTRDLLLVQGLPQDMPICCELHARPASPRDQVKEMRLLKQVNKLVVITSQLQKQFIQAGVPPERILCAPDGVDLQRFRDYQPASVVGQAELRRKLGLPEAAWIVGYAGRLPTLGKQKGLGDLLQAFKLLRQQQAMRNPVLVVVGGPDEMIADLQAHAAEIGLDPAAVCFAG